MKSFCDGASWRTSPQTAGSVKTSLRVLSDVRSVNFRCGLKLCELKKMAVDVRVPVGSIDGICFLWIHDKITAGSGTEKPVQTIFLYTFCTHTNLNHLGLPQYHLTEWMATLLQTHLPFSLKSASTQCLFVPNKSLHSLQCNIWLLVVLSPECSFQCKFEAFGVLPYFQTLLFLWNSYFSRSCWFSFFL